MDFLTELDRIASKDVNTLTEADIAFLKARKSYLNDSQLYHLESIFEPQEELSYKDLQKRAKEQGIAPVGKSKEELKQLLNIN
jgi:hypothetical protein